MNHHFHFYSVKLFSASHYDIRYVDVEIGRTNTNEKLFDNAVGLRKKDIVKGTLKKRDHDTNQAYEEYEMIVKREVFSKAGRLYYVIVKAFDSTSNSFKRVSNIVLVCSSTCLSKNKENMISQPVESRDIIKKIAKTESYSFDYKKEAFKPEAIEPEISPTIYQQTRTKIEEITEEKMETPESSLEVTLPPNIIAMTVSGCLLFLAVIVLISLYLINQCRKKDYPVTIYTVNP